MDYLGTVILATGALGTAAFGIVEGLKWTRLGTAGFGQLPKVLGPLMRALQAAYGNDHEALLKAKYREGRGHGDLRRLLRQGIRVGLRPDLAPDLARHVATVESEALTRAAERVQTTGDETLAEDRGVLGRFELAVDARIDAALTLAESRYQAAMRWAAAGFSLLIALAVAFYLQATNDATRRIWLLAVVVGLAAVPLAPIAKDVASAVTAASKALRRRS